jgi:hypothetical protein
MCALMPSKAEEESLVRRAAFLICIAAVAIVPGTARAAAPLASTSAATAVTGTTATLNGTVFPSKEATTYHFDYGTTTDYGSQTPAAGPVGGNAGKAASADITGLTPLTTYHFRLVATNASGTATGTDVEFATTTGGPPPGPTVTIAAAPTTVTFGKAVTIAGQVSGSPGVKVTLEQTPFPFTDAFKSLAGGTTDTAANYSFPVAPALNTRYHVAAKSSPPATSADVTVLVRPKVTLRLGDRTPRRGQRVRFKGSVLPAHDGKPVRIQRKTSTGWKTVAQPVLKPAAPLNGVPRSKYRKRIRIRRSGAYRTVFVPGDGDHVRGKSAKRRARVH